MLEGPFRSFVLHGRLVLDIIQAIFLARIRVYNLLPALIYAAIGATVL